MTKKLNLYTIVKNILKEVRFGNLSSRINDDLFPNDTEFVKDFNNMIDAISDREKMIKEYQATILSKNEYLKSLFNMLNESAMTIAEDFTIININDVQAKLFRKTKRQLIGKKLPDILKKYKITDVKNPIRNIDYQSFFEIDRKNYHLAFELKKIKSYFSVSIKSFKNPNDEINYFIVSKDITSDVKLEKLKNTFIATLTHDLKVPILAEAKVLNLLSKDSYSNNIDFQKEAFANMIANNNDMLSLVTTLLDVYKMEDGSYKITKTNFDIIKVIEDEIEKLKYISEENKCDIKIESSLKNIFIDADSDEISRVIKNLLTNALSFSPKNSSITIKISKTETNICISVSETYPAHW